MASYEENVAIAYLIIIGVFLLFAVVFILDRRVNWKNIGKTINSDLKNIEKKNKKTVSVVKRYYSDSKEGEAFSKKVIHFLDGKGVLANYVIEAPSDGDLLIFSVLVNAGDEEIALRELKKLKV